MRPQIEDRLWPELYDALRGLRPRHNEWMYHRSFEAAIHRGGSGNWPWMVAGICALRGADTSWVREYTFRNHDWDLNEPNADDHHHLYILCGKTAARDALRGKDHLMAIRLSEDLLQYWAVELLCSTRPKDLGQNWCNPPGARASAPTTERGIREYLLLRAAGWSHDLIRKRAAGGKRMCKIVDRTYKNQEVPLRANIDELAASFQRDFEIVYSSFQNGGWRALETYLTHGTRVIFDYVRTERGYAAVMTKNCNANNGPRWAVVADSVRNTLPLQFPRKAVKRMQFENGWARISYNEGRKVKAHSENSGDFESPLPSGEVVAWFTSSPNGWQDSLALGRELVDLGLVPDPGRPPVVGEPIEATVPEMEVSWWAKLKEIWPWK